MCDVCVSGSGAETQHHPPDVRGEGRGGSGAEDGPGRRKEHVQNPDRRAAEEPEIDSWALCCFGDGDQRPWTLWWRGFS